MSHFWKRKEDPRNLEELLVSEHMRLTEVNAEQIEEIKDLHGLLRTQGDVYAERVDRLKEELENEKKHCQEVIMQHTGVVDCHEETTLYLATYCSSYNIKSYIDGHTDQEKLNTINALLKLSGSTFIKKASSTYCQYHDAVCSFEERVFPYKLKVQHDNSLLTLYYDPDFHLCRLINAKEVPIIDDWCKADPDAIKKKLEERTKDALREAKRDLEKCIKEEESDDE